MTDETVVAEQQTTEQVTIDYKALYEQAQQDLEKVVAKKDELLNETKKAKQERQETLAQAERIKLEQAEKNGEFENLWKTSQQRQQELEKQFNEYKTQIRTEKVNNNAMRLAVDLAKGDGDRAELLSAFISQSLAKVADEDGNVSSDVINAVKRDFETNKKFAPLLGGSLASGGGASGNMTSSAPVQKDDSNLSPVDRINKARGLTGK